MVQKSWAGGAVWPTLLETWVTQLLMGHAKVGFHWPRGVVSFPAIYQPMGRSSKVWGSPSPKLSPAAAVGGSGGQVFGSQGQQPDPKENFHTLTHSHSSSHAYLLRSKIYNLHSLLGLEFVWVGTSHPICRAGAERRTRTRPPSVSGAKRARALLRRPPVPFPPVAPIYQRILGPASIPSCWV